MLRCAAASTVSSRRRRRSNCAAWTSSCSGSRTHGPIAQRTVRRARKAMNDVGRNQYQMQEGIAASVEGVRTMAKRSGRAQRVSDDLLRNFGEYVKRIGAAQQTRPTITSASPPMSNTSRSSRISKTSICRPSASCRRSLTKPSKRCKTPWKACFPRSTRACGGRPRRSPATSDAMRQAGDTLYKSSGALLGGVSQDIDRSIISSSSRSTRTADGWAGWSRTCALPSRSCPNLLDGAAETVRRPGRTALRSAAQDAAGAVDEAADRLGGR